MQSALPAPPSVPAVSPMPSGSTGSTLQSMLLSDIRAIFAKSGKPALFSSDLLSELCALPDRPWSGPKPLTLTALARRLQGVGVHLHTIRDQGRQGRAYHLADFPAV